MAQRPSLIPKVIEMGISSAEMLQEVQARQVIYGGSEELNLVELQSLTEEQLVEAISLSVGAPTAAPGPLPVDPATTARLNAAECDAVAGKRSDGRVLAFVLSAEPGLVAEIRRLCGTDAEVQVASSLRFDEARSLCSGRPVEPRLGRVLDRWGSRLELPAGPGLSDDQPTAVAHLPPVQEASVQTEPPRSIPEVAPRPAGTPPHGMRPVSNKSIPLEEGPAESALQTAPPPQGYEDVTARSAAQSARQPEVSVRYSFEQARADLSKARTRDRIVDIAVTFAAGHFAFAAAFGLSKTEAKGLASRGAGSPTRVVKELTVPLDLPSALSKVQRSCEPEVIRLRASGMEGGIARDLARAPGLDVYLHPIGIRGRALLLLLCDQGGQTVGPEGPEALTTLTPHVVDALTRVLLEKKRASRMAQPADVAEAASETSPDPTRKPATFTEPPPPAEERPEAAKNHSGVGTQRNPAAPPAAASSRPPSAGEAPSAAGRSIEAPSVEAPSVEAPSVEAPSVDRAPHEVAPAKKRALTRPQRPPGEETEGDSEPPQSFPAEAPRTLRGYPKGPPPVSGNKLRTTPSVPQSATPKSERTPQRAPLMSRRIVPLGKSTSPSGAPPVADESEEPEATGARARLRNIEAERSLSGTAPHFEAPQSTSFSAQVSERPPAPKVSAQPDPPIPTSSSETLLSQRSPVFDADDQRGPRTPPERSSRSVAEESSRKSFSDLVADLLAGDASALERLVDGGESAVGALIAVFPGPVTPPSHPMQPASACGPVLEALARLGATATPFITVRTADEDADVRRWATLLLGELPGREAARAIASRLLDTSVEVRRAALASARRARNDSLTRRNLRAHMEGMCRDTNLAEEERIAAMEALADIREHEAVPCLLRVLESRDPSLQRSARWALSVLTRQDFGTDTAAWRGFWQQHRDEDRVEWLINSLDHENRDIRRAAGEELRSLSGQDFGFDEDQGQAGRRQAQAAFRSWWIEIGKASLS